MHSPECVLENEMQKLSWGFDVQMDHLFSAGRPDFKIFNKKEKWQNCVLAIIADHRVKLKESEKKAKYLDLAREVKKLWNMKVMVIPIVTGAFGTITKILVKGLEELKIRGRVETIQTTALLSTTKMLRRVLETWGNFCHSDSSEIPSANHIYQPLHSGRIWHKVNF